MTTKWIQTASKSSIIRTKTYRPDQEAQYHDQLTDITKKRCTVQNGQPKMAIKRRHCRPKESQRLKRGKPKQQSNEEETVQYAQIRKRYRQTATRKFKTIRRWTLDLTRNRPWCSLGWNSVSRTKSQNQKTGNSTQRSKLRCNNLQASEITLWWYDIGFTLLLY